MKVVLTLAFGMNIAVLAMIVPQIMANNAGMTQAYGPDSPARRILTAVYISILVASVIGIGLIVFGATAQAAALGLALFGVQVIYKTLTWPMVGLDNPVVVANLAINVILLAGIVGAWSMLRH